MVCLHQLHSLMVAFQTNVLRTALLGACVLALALTGCDANQPVDADRPTLIAPEAFEAVGADFPEAQNRSGQAGAHFTNAALRVGVVNLAVSLHLLIPHLATAAALDAEPVVEAGTWIWSNTVRINQEEVTFDLAGTPDGDGVDWSMRVSTTDPDTGETFDDFELYTAQTSFDGRSGDWQLYHRIEGEHVRVLEADFDADSETQRQLGFRVPVGVGEHGGDSVLYTEGGASRAFDWTQVAEGFNHAVQWDAITYAGSIMATNYNDGARACWNADLEDVPCP